MWGLALRRLYRCGEDRRELIGFLQQALGASLRHEIGIYHQFEPEERLVRLLEDHPEFGDELAP